MLQTASDCHVRSAAYHWFNCRCRHGDELPSEIENLWSKLANNRRNIIPILDFLATLGTHMAYQVSIIWVKDSNPAVWWLQVRQFYQDVPFFWSCYSINTCCIFFTACTQLCVVHGTERDVASSACAGGWVDVYFSCCELLQELNAMLEYLGVSKRICLYLARVGPQQTIDHLVYEISLQLHEEETVTAGGSSQMMASNMQDRGDTPLQFAAALMYEAPGTQLSCNMKHPHVHVPHLAVIDANHNLADGLKENCTW